MGLRDNLIEKLVAVVWTAPYMAAGAATPTIVRVLDVGDGLIYLQEEREDGGETIIGNPFWVPVTAIEHMAEG